MIPGFCKEEENPLGPVHAYVAPGMADAVNKRVFPTHKGLLLDATGGDGIGLTVTKIEPAGPVHPFTVAVTEYDPAPAIVILLMIGFCKEDENPFGPDQL